MAHDERTTDQRRLWQRFWRSASGFWRGAAGWRAWALTGALVTIVVCQLYVQYRLNFWNRSFFDALERRDATGLKLAALLFFPLAAANVTLAVVSVWGRMTTQRKWREWLTTHLIGYWLGEGRYRRLSRNGGGRDIPEYRIAEDARIATDAPIDFAIGLFSSVLTAIVFIDVLWHVGGDIRFSAFGTALWIPGYLVVSVIVYSAVATGAMMKIGRALIAVIQGKNQKEAELITAAHRLRDLGENDAPSGRETRDGLWAALRNALAQWLKLCWQLMGTTLVSQTNTLVAPVMGLVLCAPKFLAGELTLGELTQAAAAFTIVQAAFNWLVDNYGRVADWLSSVNRVAELMFAIDALESAPPARPEAGQAVREKVSQD